ncbi:MAG TPA: DUF2231 domain-containing protein [Steroidobacteraceae bacterium]
MLRTHEIHPSIVHFPLTLVPAALALDAIGEATDSEALMNAGKVLMPIAAASAAIAGVAGFIAQGAVRAEGEAHEMLVTHRNLNAALVGATTAMAIYRQSRRRPGLGYLLAGAAGLLAMSYTAYLGGKMVYAHGVGVEPQGVDVEKSPELRAGELGRAARESARHIVEQTRVAAREAAAGEIAPAARTLVSKAARGDGAAEEMLTSGL